MKLDPKMLTRILDSFLFEKILEKASFLITKNRKLSSVAIAALKKLIKTRSLSELGQGIMRQIKLLSSLTYFYAKGQYTDLSKRSMIIIVGSILYFILPIDLVPDFIPGMGYLDDITLIGWVFSTLSKEIDLFEKWYKKYNMAETIKYIDLD